MAYIIIPDSELILAGERDVDRNGCISVGRQFKGETVKVYVVEVIDNGTINPQA